MTEKELEDLKKEEEKNGKEKTSTTFKDIILIFVMAMVLAAVFKTFIIDTRIVPTLSMYPTIHADDKVFVNRLGYIFGSPDRGDVIVFKPNKSVQTHDDYLKRIIGEPGDTVQVHDGKVYVNGVALIEPYIAEEPEYEFGPVTVPDGYYFMLGDNRNESYDSHRWPDPFVKESSIKGKAFYVYWPSETRGSINNDTPAFDSNDTIEKALEEDNEVVK